jgi:hypothetical protein
MGTLGLGARRAVTYGTAAILLALGLSVVMAPDAIPGLTTPGNPMGPMDRIVLAAGTSSRLCRKASARYAPRPMRLTARTRAYPAR